MEVCENKKMYRLREATEEDMMLYFEWANDPVVRRNSFSTETIDLATHEAWFRRKVTEETCLLYVLTDGTMDYGQVRGQVDDGKIEIGYSIAKEHRGKGLARVMLKLFEEKCKELSLCDKVKKDKPMETDFRMRLYAEVKKENPISGKVFEGLGYQKQEEPEIFVYTKEL